jgi:hypothetical protein
LLQTKKKTKGFYTSKSKPSEKSKDFNNLENAESKLNNDTYFKIDEPVCLSYVDKSYYDSKYIKNNTGSHSNNINNLINECNKTIVDNNIDSLDKIKYLGNKV